MAPCPPPRSRGRPPPRVPEGAGLAWPAVRGALIAWRGLWLGALAFAGVVVTHALSYRLAIPDHGARHEVLHHTGHGMWPPIIGALALAAVVAGLAGSLTPQAAARPASMVRSVAARLALLQ